MGINHIGYFIYTGNSGLLAFIRRRRVGLVNRILCHFVRYIRIMHVGSDVLCGVVRLICHIESCKYRKIVKRVHLCIYYTGCPG